MINDAAQYDAATGSLTLNVPKGGQLDESRYESYSYTTVSYTHLDVYKRQVSILSM